MTHNPLIKKLLLKFAEGNCSEAEKQLLAQLLKDSEEEEGMPSVEETEELFADDSIPPMDPAVSERVFQEIVDQPAPRKPIDFRPVFRIAASIALILLAGLGMRYYSQSQLLIMESQYGEIRNITLDDGSEIKLNANTTLEVYKNFAKNEIREVWIDGEAFFRVAHDVDRPFIVHTPRGMDIQVLGTEFNVNSRSQQAQVVLNEGSVQVSLSEEGNTLQERMEPGQMIVADPKYAEMYKSRVDTLYYASWKYNLLAFRGEHLKEVAQVIEDRYGYQVRFGSPDIDELRFTGSVPSDDLNLVLNMIAKTFDLDVRKSGKVIFIENHNNV